MPRLHLHLCRVYTYTYAAFTLSGFVDQEQTKSDVCENGFPSFEHQISCLQF